MLERLAQLVVDKLEPKIERIVQSYLDELRIELIDQIIRSFAESGGIFAESVEGALPELEKRLKREITQQIVRGVRG